MNTIGETAAIYSLAGRDKTRMPAWKMLLLGIVAGVYIALAGAAANTAVFAVANPGLAKLISAVIFPAGLCMIILCGAELFTGNCLITISVLDKKADLTGMGKNLIMVYLGNFIGAAAIAAICVYCGQMDLGSGELAVYTIKIAAAKCSISFWKAVGLGVCCNVLVATGVIMSLCGRDAAGRILGAYLPVMLFVLCGFEHCIANMYYIPAGIFAATVEDYARTAAASGIDLSVLNAAGLLRNLLPVTIGNLIGGCALGIQLYWCRLRQESGKTEK